MTMLEQDLLSVLRELLEASLAMTDGTLHSGNDMERYQRAIEWSRQIIERAERDK